MVLFAARDSFIKDGGIKFVSIEDLDHDECAICFYAYLAKGFETKKMLYEEPIQLPCSHILGSQCLLRWTLRNNTCPFCRCKLFALRTFAEREVEDSEQEIDYPDTLLEDLMVCHEQWMREFADDSGMNCDYDGKF